MGISIACVVIWLCCPARFCPSWCAQRRKLHREKVLALLRRKKGVGTTPEKIEETRPDKSGSHHSFQPIFITLALRSWEFLKTRVLKKGAKEVPLFSSPPSASQSSTTKGETQVFTRPNPLVTSETKASLFEASPSHAQVEASPSHAQAEASPSHALVETSPSHALVETSPSHAGVSDKVVELPQTDSLHSSRVQPLGVYLSSRPACPITSSTWERFTSEGESWWFCEATDESAWELPPGAVTSCGWLHFKSEGVWRHFPSGLTSNLPPSLNEAKVNAVIGTSAELFATLPPSLPWSRETDSASWDSWWFQNGTEESSWTLPHGAVTTCGWVHFIKQGVWRHFPSGATSNSQPPSDLKEATRLIESSRMDK